ncbi:hypothetical protein OTERR_25560 [Oryzomicrobium terrae]|uniref:Uncharacterized protein n=1 Tax=Oryzomicrobium terrae TaxID=1735038 RepID=A0A5C1EAY7_9RHOO|nr:hypothetical protein [Oryzomicrobium terrae]QEL66032.1 hypothetical protein OTERR_25560 [Oryzomicrobium terrae]
MSIFGLLRRRGIRESLLGLSIAAYPVQYEGHALLLASAFFLYVTSLLVFVFDKGDGWRRLFFNYFSSKTGLAFFAFSLVCLVATLRGIFERPLLIYFVFLFFGVNLIVAVRLQYGKIHGIRKALLAGSFAAVIYIQIWGLIGQFVHNDRFFYQGWYVNGSAFNFWLLIPICAMAVIRAVRREDCRYELSALLLMVCVGGYFDSRISMLVPFVILGPYFFYRARAVFFGALIVGCFVVHVLGLATNHDMVFGKDFSPSDFLARHINPLLDVGRAVAIKSSSGEGLSGAAGNVGFKSSDYDRLLPIFVAIKTLESEGGGLWGHGMYSHQSLMYSRMQQATSESGIEKSTNNGVVRTSTLPSMLIDVGYFGVFLLFVVAILSIWKNLASLPKALKPLGVVLPLTNLGWIVIMNVTISPFFYLLLVPMKVYVDLSGDSDSYSNSKLE